MLYWLWLKKELSPSAERSETSCSDESPPHTIAMLRIFCFFLLLSKVVIEQPEEKPEIVVVVAFFTIFLPPALFVEAKEDDIGKKKDES